MELEGNNPCSCSALFWMFIFFLATAANVAWIVMMFLNFGSIEGCSLNLALLIVTTVLSVLMQFVVCLRLRSDASELTSALVILYCLFLQWSALSSNPDPVCNPHEDSSGTATARLVINLIVTFTAMFTAAATVEDEIPDSATDGKTDQLSEPILPAATSDEAPTTEQPKTADETADDKPSETKQETSAAATVPAKPEKLAVSKQELLFQMLFGLAAIYYAMLLTNWGSPDSLTEGTDIFGSSSKMSFWIQQIAQWVTIAIYMFSQVAVAAPE